MGDVGTETKPVTPPEWLNSAFLETVLRKSEGDKDLHVVSIESTPVGKPGEYLASQLFRLTVQYKGTKMNDSKKLVVKIQPEKGILADTMDSSLFKTELKMYGEFLPKLERILAENEKPLLLPKCIHVSAVPQPIVILEDLAPVGWKGHDLIESFEEAKPITTAIARFHAASFYLSKNKTDFESFQTDLFEKKHPVLEWMFGKNLKAFNEALRTWPGCEQFVEPFERAFADYCDRLHSIYSCKTSGRLYNVLNHGDFHAKNLLHQFNDENGGIVESRFLDFQACCWSTPAIDLYYLLNNIVHYKVKAAHKDDLISFYHAEFTATLKAIGFLGYIPTMLDLQIELLRSGFLDILHYTCFLQFRFIDFSKVPPENLATGQVGNLGLENEEYQTLMKSLIPGYLHKGLLDIFCTCTHHRNRMHLTSKDPTSWLNGPLFQKALVQYTADRSLEVEDVHLAVHGNIAQQYASTIYRACVSYRSRGKAETIKLIVKLITSKVNSLADELTYDTELKVYRDFLRKMNALLSDDVTPYFGPKLIYSSDEPVPYLILEDLSSHQFVHSNKLLAVDDAKIVLFKLAQFHATSYSLSNTSAAGSLDALNNGLFKQKPSEGVSFMLENFTIFAEELSKWDGYTKYAQRLQNLQPTFIERGAAIYRARGFGYSMLNHGDFHYNNMLFKFDADQRVQDVVFYDFQLSCWTTPAVDLLYFLYFTCNRETRDTQRHQLIQLYHQEFTRTLDSVGYMGKVPTLLDINCDLQRAGFLEIVLAICFIPFLFADYNQSINVYGKEEDARAYRRQLYNREEYQEIIKPLLPYFLHKGFLD
ncbi:uncharacterized protein LOC125764589 [Anopheles funestus]|uniref:uncharacterized protein LOC125764589 n=1 Tax=Anopheles funestus TaxID=62324 RepID=UPI0020C70BA3|nr:uncharacterized protein LOC125764589 [Anopheles funestus]